MNSMQDALQEALEHPRDIVTGQDGARMHLAARDHFWWGVLGYVVGTAMLYRLYRSRRSRSANWA